MINVGVVIPCIYTILHSQLLPSLKSIFVQKFVVLQYDASIICTYIFFVIVNDQFNVVKINEIASRH